MTDWLKIRDEQIQHLRELQELNNREILVQNQSDVKEPWITLETFEGSGGSAIKFRSILYNELVFEVDNENWNEMYAQTKKVYEWLTERRGPVYIVYTGGKSLHLRVYMNVVTVETDKETLKMIEEYGIDLWRVLRIFFYDEVKRETGAEIDKQMFSWGSDTKGHMERMEGSIHESGGFCSYLSSLPEKKPADYELQFMPKPELWDISPFREEINAYLRELISVARREDPGRDLSLSGIDYADVSCLKNFLEKGAKLGQRHSGLYSVVSLCRELGLPIEPAKEIASSYLRACEDQGSINWNADMKNVEEIYSKKKRFSCYTLRDNFEGYCDRRGCSIYTERKKGAEESRITEIAPDGEQKEDCSEYPEIRIGDNDHVRIYPDKICRVSYYNVKGKDREKERNVISGHFDILEKYYVDGMPIFKVKTERELYGPIEDICKALIEEGMVTSGGQLKDTVGAMASQMRDVKTGHGGMGVYEGGDRKLKLCLNPIAVTDEQRNLQIILEMRKVFEHWGTREEFEAYVSFREFFHPHEVYPVMGFSVMAPFSLVLKTYGYLIPVIYHLAKRRNVGKSGCAKAFTEKLFGTPVRSADTIINSPFRFNEISNSAGLPFLFDEGEKVNFDTMVVIRESCENTLLSSRGRPDLSQIRYMNRALFVFTGNDIRAKQPEALKRICVIPYDENRVMTEDYKVNSKVFNRHLNGLRPLGYDIIRYALRFVNTTEKLLEMVEKYTREMEEAKHDWEDVTKPRTWAVCYFGLKFWEEYGRSLGVEWKAPTVEDFVKQVVNKVEGSTWENMEEPVRAFIDWFEGWKTKNTTKKITVDTKDGSTDEETVIRGENEIWKAGELKISEIQTIEGCWITNTILQEYQKERNLPGISSLKRLAEGVSQVFNIPLASLLDEEQKRVRNEWFWNRSKRAVFIPLDGG